MNLFLVESSTGERPCHRPPEDSLNSPITVARYRMFATDPKWKDLIFFYEYFHGDTGRGLGASHQTGWSAIVASCALKIARARERNVIKMSPWFIADPAQSKK